MGIDPLTHKPLSTIQEPQQQLQPQQEQQEQENKKEATETSLETATIEVVREEEKSTLMFDPMEEMTNSFCTDEVPLIEADEILLPSSSSSFSSGSNNNNILQELQSPDFEWLCGYNNNSQLGLWDDEFTSWDWGPQCPRMVLDQEYSWTPM